MSQVVEKLVVPSVDFSINELFKRVGESIPDGMEFEISITNGSAWCSLSDTHTLDAVECDDEDANLGEQIAGRINKARKAAGLPPVEFPVTPPKPAVYQRPEPLAIVYGEYENVKLIIGSLGLLVKLVTIVKLNGDITRHKTGVTFGDVTGPISVIDAFLAMIEHGERSMVIECQPGILSDNNLMLLRDVRLHSVSHRVAADGMAIVPYIQVISTSEPGAM